MIQYILWGVSFVSLWLTLVWLNILFSEQAPKQRPCSKLPFVSIVIPVYNRAKSLEKTISSIAKLDYPLKLFEVIIINDGSTDNSLSVARRLSKKFNRIDIRVFSQKNSGKAGAMNTALRHARGTLFSCLDSDTRVNPDALKLLVPHFDEPKIGGVITMVKVDAAGNIFEKTQRIEYVMSNFLRRMMSSIRTLAITPGVLSVYRAETLKKLGGFVPAGMTEDLEIALRLKANNYDVKMEPRAVTYTIVPQTFGSLWRQRLRWYRGFIVNHLKYRHLFFSRKHGLLGIFQLPMNLVSVFLLLLTILLVSYGSVREFAEFVSRSFTIKGYLVSQILDFPSLKEIILANNIQIFLPIAVVAGLCIYIICTAHKLAGERLFRHIHFAWIYFFIMPYLTGLHWICSIFQETVGFRRKW